MYCPMTCYWAIAQFPVCYNPTGSPCPVFTVMDKKKHTHFNRRSVEKDDGTVKHLVKTCRHFLEPMKNIMLQIRKLLKTSSIRKEDYA